MQITSFNYLMKTEENSKKVKRMTDLQRNVLLRAFPMLESFLNTLYYAQENLVNKRKDE